MSRNLFANWSIGTRAAFFVLWAAAVIAAVFALRGARETEADLNLSFERCILETSGSFGLSGFSPVSECLLSRIDAVYLGPGRLVMPDGQREEEGSFSLHLRGNRPSGVVEIDGRDIALGRVAMGAGRLDIQSLGTGCLGVDYVPDSAAGGSKGELSPGDSCRLRAWGYELRIDGVAAPAQSGDELSGVFYPLGGAAQLVDEEGGFGFQVKIAARAFEFTSPARISAIRFLNKNGQCAGVSTGSIRTGRERTETRIPRNACVRVAGERLELRYLGMAAASSELSVDLSGRLSSLELNQVKLVRRPFLPATLTGLLFLTLFGATVELARRLPGLQNVRHGGHGPGGLGPQAAEPRADHVFVSYSRHDKRYALGLAQDMRERGYSVWLDENLHGGDEWLRRVRERIEDCAVVVVVVTPESIASRWVEIEMFHATDSGKKIVPLLLRGRELPPVLKPRHGIDVRDGNLPPNEFYATLDECAPKWPAGAELSRQKRVRIEEALGRIGASGHAVFKCSGCGFPVGYDTMSGAALALLFGLPSIGAAVVHSVSGWKAALIFGIAALALARGLLSTAEELFREPSRCPDCARVLKKPLARHEGWAAPQ